MSDAAEAAAGPPWKILDALFAIFMGLIAVAVAFVALGREPSTSEIFLVVLPAQEAGTFLGVYLVTRFRATGHPVADLGIRLRWSDWWLVPAGIGLQIVLSLALLLIVDLEEAPQEIARLTAEATGSAALLAFFLTVVVVPVLEEAVFRGLLLQALLRWMPRAAAIALSAAAFALFHLAGPESVVVVVPLFIVGLALGYAALSGPDLSRPILLHMGFNLVPAVLLLGG